MFPLASAVLSFGSRLALPRILPYLNKIVGLGLFAIGAYGTVGQIPHQNIKTGSASSSVPVVDDDVNNSSSVPVEIVEEINNTFNNISSVVSSFPSVDVPNVDVDVVSSTVENSQTLLDILKSSSVDTVSVLNNLVKAIYDLQQVITASTMTISQVLDNGFTALSVSNVSNSFPISNVINNSVSVDTSPIATTLKPAIDSISEKLESQKKYYDEVLKVSDITDLDGNVIVSGNSIEIDKIHKATISRAMTDLNNFSPDDLDDDIDFNNLLQDIDLSQLFKLIRLSSQLENNGSINNGS